MLDFFVYLFFAILIVKGIIEECAMADCDQQLKGNSRSH